MFGHKPFFLPSDLDIIQLFFRVLGGHSLTMLSKNVQQLARSRESRAAGPHQYGI
jgi:hypothetical protein